MFPEPPEPSLAEVWATLRRRLPCLAAYDGPGEVGEGVVLHELAAQGVSCLPKLGALPQGAYYHSFTWENSRIKVSCNLTVGTGKFDWVTGVGPTSKEAFVRAALKALEWVDRRQIEEDRSARG